VSGVRQSQSHVRLDDLNPAHYQRSEHCDHSHHRLPNVFSLKPVITRREPSAYVAKAKQADASRHDRKYRLRVQPPSPLGAPIFGNLLRSFVQPVLIRRESYHRDRRKSFRYVGCWITERRQLARRHQNPHITICEAEQLRRRLDVNARRQTSGCPGCQRRLCQFVNLTSVQSGYRNTTSHFFNRPFNAHPMLRHRAFTTH
jgi:hypothetical protein